MTRAISHTISNRPDEGANWMERALKGFALPGSGFHRNGERKQFDTRQDRCPKR